MKMFRRIGFALVAALFMSVHIPATVYAIDDNQRQLFRNDVLYFNYSTDDFSNGCGPSSQIVSASASSSAAVDNSSVRATGVQGPYILEQFAIEVLKSVAIKRGVSEADVVTPEHTIGLLAFMLGEGGDINNQWQFNPLNSGLQNKELLAAPAAGKANGTQSFKDFDSGVEATARTMVGGTQSRLADILTQKDSTAEQFMETLTYYKRYQGNKAWAELSMEPSENPLGIGPVKYLEGRIGFVNTVRSKYVDIASLQIGTPEKDQQVGNRIPDKIFFKDLANASGSASPASGISPAATGGAGGAACAGNSAGATIVGDTAFPLKGDKSVVKDQSIFANGTTKIGGHPYTAYDILADPGTTVVAMMDGDVTWVGSDKCPGSRAISITNKEQNITISYLHMDSQAGADLVNEQTKGVIKGQPIGQVGQAGAGCGTPHLHIDAAKGGTRPGCARENCPAANAAQFIDIGPQLFTTFQAMGTQPQELEQRT